MGFSYSKVGTYSECPYKYKLVYLDKLEAIPPTEPSCALFIGTAIHEGIERRSIDAGVDSYKSNFADISDKHELEIFKIKTALSNVMELVPEGEYEYKLLGKDGFIGFIDILVKVDDETYDIIDMKCSNNIEGYKNSAQVHLYKYYFEQLTGKKIRDLYYLFIHKTKETSKEKIVEDLNNNKVTFLKVNYSEDLVNEFFNKRDTMLSAKYFPKVHSFKCRWCDFAKYCRSNGKDRSELKEEQVVSPVELF